MCRMYSLIPAVSSNTYILLESLERDNSLLTSARPASLEAECTSASLSLSPAALIHPMGAEVTICYTSCIPCNPALQLISPCRCKGTLKYVHQSCLHKWQSNVQRLGGKRDERATVCGVCRTAYTSLPPQAAVHVWYKVRQLLLLLRHIIIESSTRHCFSCRVTAVERS